MQEQPNISSAEPSPSPDAEASAQTSEQASESSSESSPNWWQRITRRQPRGREETEPSQETETSAEPDKVVLSQTELERRVQAETDRREAKRASEAAARARRELRDKDPWAYAEEERKTEQAQMGNVQLESFVNNVGSEHDRVTIDPIFLALPKSEQERITKLDGAGVGLAGRKLVVSESLKALEKHWKAEGEKAAEARLRKNAAFRKQILSEARGGYAEPELLPGASGSSQTDQNVSNILRGYYDLPTPRDHNNSSG
jgi:hypothetical protein